MATQVAVNTKVEESIAFARGRQSLDRSVWYSGSLFTFLATGEETQGQFALIEVVARKGNAPPPHLHHREDETFYVLEGEMTVSCRRSNDQGHAGNDGLSATRRRAFVRDRIRSDASARTARARWSGGMVQGIQRSSTSPDVAARDGSSL